MWLVALALLAPNSPSIYVATDGDDSWSGRLVRPNRSRTDGPLRTIQAAGDRVRHTRDARVEIEGGHYRLERPLEFRDPTAPDTNDILSRHAFSPYDDRRPVYIDGSRRITGWRIDARGWWHATLPEVASGKWNFIQLWVNGERRFRPRTTRNGYDLIVDQAAPSPEAAGKGFDRFVYKPGDLDPSWHNLGDVELLVVQTWSMARMRIKSIDAASHVVTMTGHSASTAGWSAFPKGNRYIVENVREALGRSGDWYLDRSTGELTYVPKKGETPSKTDVEAPVCRSLLIDEGTQQDMFYRLHFQYTNWETPAEGHDYAQADIDVGAALEFRGAVRPILLQCSVEHTGAYAVSFDPGCLSPAIQGCRLDDLGGGGVLIGATTGLAEHGVYAMIGNNRLVSGGRLHPAAVGVWIGDDAGNNITNNEIRDFYYTGVSVGWTWGYAPTHSGHNNIADNIISDIGQHVLSDMGGIYTLGDQHGTKLNGNVIHDVTCYAYGGWGIYPDEGSTDEVIENNVVYRCQSAGFHQHYGKNNLVHNNIFAMNGDAEIVRTRAEDHTSFVFDRNIIAWATGQPFGGNWSGSGFGMKHDLYWHYGGFVSPPAQETNAVVADPMFVDPLHADFRLRPGSPALAMGFRPIDASAAGPLRDGMQAAAVTSAPRAFPDPYAAGIRP